MILHKICIFNSAQKSITYNVKNAKKRTICLKQLMYYYQINKKICDSKYIEFQSEQKVFIQCKQNAKKNYLPKKTILCISIFLLSEIFEVC